MTPNLLDELEKIVALSEGATPGEWRYFPKRKYNEHHVSVPSEASSFHIGLFPDGCPTDRPAADAELIARSVNFLRTHHATLADMAKRLEAAERDAARYRFLRDAEPEKEWEDAYRELGGCARAEQVDAAIDAAIDATQEGEG